MSPLGKPLGESRRIPEKTQPVYWPAMEMWMK